MFYLILNSIILESVNDINNFICDRCVNKTVVLQVSSDFRSNRKDDF